MISARYSRNIGALTKADCLHLQRCRVFIAGCGGLGGHLLSHLLRIGVGHITAADRDVFEASNLNRQLLCTENTLGCPKVKTAAEYAALVNPDVSFQGLQVNLDETNCASLITGHDLVLDALDNIAGRRTLAAACDRQNIPLIYGAICGWVAQVSVLSPSSALRCMEQLYPMESALKDKACLSFTPAICASIQSAEAIKALLGQPSELKGNLLYLDLFTCEWELLPLPV